MIIDTSYFLNKSVFIPNAVKQPSIGGNTPDAVSQLTEEINEKEAKLLIMALGYEQYLELSEQFETNGEWKSDALDKWKELVDGVTYGEKRWNGLRYTLGTKKISLIAYYVFFYYLGEDFTSYTTTGVQSPDAENSTKQTPNHKQAGAWNTFVKMYNGSKLCSTQPSYFSNWNGHGIQWRGNTDANEVDLYEFLSNNSETYDTSFFQRQNVINAMNL